MNIEYVMHTLDKQRSDLYKPPRSYKIRNAMFYQESYKHSGYEEIKLYLIKNRGRNSIDVVEEFRRMIENYQCKKKNEETKMMLNTYYDVATDVLDVLLNIKEDQNEELCLH